MSEPSKEPDLSDVLFALSDPTRRRVVEELGRAPRRASDLALTMGVSRPGMSRHLRVLREAGVIREEDDSEDGRAHLLALDRGAFGRVHDWLDEVESYWTEQLGSFKSLAEARAAEEKGPREQAPSKEAIVNKPPRKRTS